MRTKVHKVESGETLKIKVDEGKVVFLDKAILGNETQETVYLKVCVDGGEELVAGRLNSCSWPKKVLNIAFDKDFQFTHTGTDTSVKLYTILSAQRILPYPFLKHNFLQTQNHYVYIVLILKFWYC
ncbi:unnamed protein product [Lactuca virosa]|uniref:Uncharacterized protein n=1 Tax=Lactuca virosa TaxID=75947 RepID=A0AAU9M511_9ASTR|nr:unnamed protein product [Lactuca virosa]